MIQIEKKVFPNGEEYLELLINNTKIGIVVEVDGGYLPMGKRKPRSTIKDCAKELIDTKLSRLANESQKWHKLLNIALQEGKV